MSGPAVSAAKPPSGSRGASGADEEPKTDATPKALSSKALTLPLAAPSSPPDPRGGNSCLADEEERGTAEESESILERIPPAVAPAPAPPPPASPLPEPDPWLCSLSGSDSERSIRALPSCVGGGALAAVGDCGGGGAGGWEEAGGENGGAAAEAAEATVGVVAAVEATEDEAVEPAPQAWPGTNSLTASTSRAERLLLLLLLLLFLPLLLSK